MGDDLPRQLYEAFLKAMGADPADAFDRWDSLSSLSRHAWERAAAKAREEIGLQFRRDMRAARDELGATTAIANLLDEAVSA